MSYGLYIYPWNIHDLDSDIVGIKGLGISELNIAASYHAGKFIQPHDKVSRVYFPEDGCVYFLPRGTRYGAIKPTPAQVTRTHDVLGDLCRRRDLKVNAWVVLNHNSRLGHLHAEANVVNAYGDRYVYSLCPANPDVREYATSLCQDLSEHYDLASLLLESPGWLTYSHGYHHEFAQVPLNSWLEGMLGLCFCPYCVAEAGRQGIDAESLSARIRARLDGYFHTDPWISAAQADRQIERDLDEDNDLGRYIDWRCGIVTSLVATIREHVRRDVRVRVISTCHLPHRAAFWEGGDLRGLYQAGDGLELPLYFKTPESAKEDAQFVLTQTGGVDKVSAILRPGFPDMTSAEQLTRTMSALGSIGIRDISFYNFGLLQERNLEWVRTSIGHIRHR